MSELFIATARDRRAAELMAEASGQTADDLLAAYERADGEIAAARTAAVVLRARVILGATYGATGTPSQTDIVAAFKQAEAEQPPAEAETAAAPPARHPSVELERQNRVHALAVAELADQGRELTHSAPEYVAAFEKWDGLLAKAGV